MENKYFSYNLQESVLIHYNHPLDQHFVEAHLICYSEEICDQIRHQSELGVLPEDQKENLDSLIENLRRNQKRIKVHDSDNILGSITVIDDEIISSNYSTDIAIIDDTAMTNIYGLPLETVIVVDQEKHTQLLGYSVILDKSGDSFSTYIDDYISLGGSPFRIIVVDRLETQNDAIIHIFPQSFIILFGTY